jgi:hypothetical protein
MNRFTNPFRYISLPLALLVLLQSLVYTPVYGLSGGPIQPEFQQTNIVGADNLVDPFSGNFNYSIPLMEIGGFPLTLSYSSDHKMEEEASWVGFGWTLNPGAITRQVRGLPDDFRGEEIVRRGNIAPSVTTGITPGIDYEIFGGFSLGAGLNFSYNNYNGFSFSRDLSPAVNLTKIVDHIRYGEENTHSDYGAPTIDNFHDLLKSKRLFASLSTNINSRSGMEEISYGGRYRLLFEPKGSIRFGGFTYTPIAELPQEYSALSYNFKIGNQNFLPDALQLSFRAHSMVQRLKSSTISQPGYGYLYLAESEGNKYALQDYNKNQGGLNLENSPRLPMAFGTPDVYAVSGPGLSGQLKISRNDLGVFRPPYVETNSTSSGVGTDLAVDIVAVPGVHVGLNINHVNIRSKTDNWTDNNELAPNMLFKANEGLRENAFMHFVGEANTQLGKNWYNDLEKEQPIAAEPTKDGRQIILENTFVSQPAPGEPTTDLSSFPTDDSAYRQRRPRTQQVTYLTAEESAIAGFDKTITSYQPLSISDNLFTNFSRRIIQRDRVDEAHQPHHVSEIRVTNNGGQRFVYGLPAYNLTKKEVTFNASGLDTGMPGSSNYNLVQYNNGTDNTPDNQRGRDNFFDEVTTGPYATSHLLTGILSPDYVDRNNDGPTLDDLGQYVQFNYTQLENDANGAIGWRAPLGERAAVFNPGNLVDTEDDKASYTYGEKEIFYLHHIDSKTHRAVFLTSDREDALPSRENGTFDSNTKLQKLDQIRLFTLSELQEKGIDAIPIKTVHFTYDANGLISGNLPNTDNGPAAARGKLTLNSVHFTYADNERGQDNPYQFSYKTTADNQHVVYQPNMTDRWGNQVPVRQNEHGPQAHPYSIQDQSIVEAYCDLGNLTNIKLPTGGTITVDYEPDDYAYVQDKRAGKMYEILGFSDDPENDYIENLYDPHVGGYDDNLYVHIAVDDLPMMGGDIDVAAAERAYFEDVRQLYFEARVELTDGDNLEKVTGYAEIDPQRAFVWQQGVNGAPDRVVVPLLGVNQNNETITSNSAMHPITFAGLEKMRLEMHRLTYSLPFSDQHFSPQQLLGALAQFGAFFQNYYQQQRIRRSAMRISSSPSQKSYLRLADGSYRKYGDGSRVRTVTLSDEWLRSIAPDQVNSYVQRYTYEQEGPKGQLISSGVAAFEPMIGKEEMLMVGVQRTSSAKALAPNESYYTTWPVGLPFYPGASVGYSQVSMTMELDQTYAQSKPGRTEYEFYTARDFPVISNFTEVFSKRHKPRPQVLPFSNIYRDRLGLSQGYTVEVNDMHGKTKRTTEYDHYDTPISSSYYRYREKSKAPGKKRKLDNLVSVSAGEEVGTNFGLDYLGMDMEMWIETTENTTKTVGGGANLNLEFEVPFSFAPSRFPSYTDAETALYTAVTTKLISRYGILEEVEVTNNGASLSTRNLRWDALTGAPLLTSTENEFGQPTYSHNLPARFIDGYEALGPAYLNEGARFSRVPIRGGRSDGNGALDLEQTFFPGDELFISYKFRSSSWRGRAHVMPDGDQLYLVWDDGSLVNSTDLVFPFDVIVLRSGRRNMLSATAEQTAALSPPNDGDYWMGIGASDAISGKLLGFSAVEYSDVWSNMCLPVPPAPELEEGGPGGGNCVVDGFLNLVLTQIRNKLNGSPASLSIQDFTEAPFENLSSCDCREIFNTYKRYGLIGNITEYGTCSGGTLSITSADVENCRFLADSYWLNGGSGPENEEPCAIQDLVFEDLNTADFPCVTFYGDLDCANTLQGPGNEVAVNKSNLSNTSTCFPWSSTNPIGNPYLDGRRGNWRVKAQYVAKQQGRAKSAVEVQAGSDALNNNYQQPLLFKDGTLDAFLPFWAKAGRTMLNGHQLVSEVIAYDDHGHDLETEDALGIASSAQYGFFQNLPTAVAQNARRTDMAYEGFEDYAYQRYLEEEVWTRHFSVINDAVPGNFRGELTTEAAHTGLYSLKIPSGPATRGGAILNYATSTCTQDSDGCEVTDPCSCIQKFAPAAAQKYQLSLWVARTESLANGEQVGTPGADQVVNDINSTFFLGIRATVNGSVQNIGAFYPSGPVIEGWQRITATVEIPANTSVFGLRLATPRQATTATTTDFYVDDLRIHPYESSMVSYAYNPFTLRLMAQMDDNGYAVFYEYDDEGQLIRQKRETERGIMTITEQHTNLANTNNDSGQ